MPIHLTCQLFSCSSLAKVSPVSNSSLLTFRQALAEIVSKAHLQLRRVDQSVILKIHTQKVKKHLCGVCARQKTTVLFLLLGDSREWLNTIRRIRRCKLVLGQHSSGEVILIAKSWSGVIEDVNIRCLQTAFKTSIITRGLLLYRHLRNTSCKIDLKVSDFHKELFSGCNDTYSFLFVEMIPE